MMYYSIAKPLFFFFFLRLKYFWVTLIISQCLVETIGTCEIVHICKHFIPVTKTHVI